MSHFYALLQSVLLLVVLVASAVWLKARGVISDDSKTSLARLTTDYALPAVIFANLAYHDIRLQQLIPAGILLAASILAMLIGYFAGRVLKLSGSRLGVFIVLTGFGSSASLGYSLIKEVYPGNSEALSDALIIGELGSTLPFFILGVAILIYFGAKNRGITDFRASFIGFLKTPIFIAVVAGILVSLAGIPLDNTPGRFVAMVLSVIGDSLIVLVALTIGLMLKPVNIGSAWLLIFVIAVIKLLIEPLIALAGADLSHLSEIEREVLLIECAMPSGAIAAVVSERYGCDGRFASVVVMITYIVGVFTVPIMFFFGIL